MVAQSHDAAARRRRSPTVLHQQKRRGGRGDGVVTRVVKKGPEPGELSDDEAEYRAMMKQTKEWMAYDPDELPESAPAPSETHVQNLMKNGPWQGATARHLPHVVVSCILIFVSFHSKPLHHHRRLTIVNADRVC